MTANSLFEFYKVVYKGKEYVSKWRFWYPSKCYFELENISTDIEFPIDQERIYWSRAYNYVSDHCYLKIEFANEYHLHTYNSILLPSQATFTINKEILDNGKFRLTINSNNYMAEKKCAFYILHGFDCSDRGYYDKAIR